MSSGLSVLVVLLKKDLLLQWRERAQSVAILAFGGASLLLFSFAVGPDAQALRQQAAGFLWLGLLLASTLSLAESFERELEDQALEGCCSCPRAPAPSSTPRPWPTGSGSPWWAWPSSPAWWCSTTRGPCGSARSWA